LTARTTATRVRPGILDVEIGLPHGLKDARVFEFQVTRTVGGVVHRGVILFHKNERDDR
jgi:hypothetical protein